MKKQKTKFLKLAEDLDARSWTGDNLYSKAAEALREAAAEIDSAEKYKWLLDQDYELWKTIGWDLWQPDPDMGMRRDKRLEEIKNETAKSRRGNIDED